MTALPPFRVQCPYPGCDRELKTWRGLGLHSTAKHGLCVNCVIRGEQECNCWAERLAEQTDHGRYYKVLLKDRRTLVLENMKGWFEDETFVTGYGCNMRTEGNYTTHVIHRDVIRRIVPLAWNIYTSELEEALEA